MKKFCFMIFCMLGAIAVQAQEDSLSRAKFVVGLSAPELLHIGINVDLSKSSQVGVAAGIGPSWGTVWPTLSAEHRFYTGKVNTFTNRKRVFLRQGVTYFPAAGGHQTAVTLAVGTDLKSKARNRGWTIDAGGFLLIQNYNDRKNIIFPALRFQYYSFFRRS